jgi:hypothetical protein
MKILQSRIHHHEVYYMLGFEYDDLPGAGFAFDCDENGIVNEAELKVHRPEAYRSLQACRSGEVNGRKVHPMGAEKIERNYNEPAIGECECGEEVVLHGFTNTCDRCERDYNQSGSLLAPREQWGEETFESLGDILRIR